MFAIPVKSQKCRAKRTCAKVRERLSPSFQPTPALPSRDFIIGRMDPTSCHDGRRTGLDFPNDGGEAVTNSLFRVRLYDAIFGLRAWHDRERRRRLRRFTKSWRRWATDAEPIAPQRDLARGNRHFRHAHTNAFRESKTASADDVTTNQTEFFAAITRHATDAPQTYEKNRRKNPLEKLVNGGGVRLRS